MQTRRAPIAATASDQPTSLPKLFPAQPRTGRSAEDQRVRPVRCVLGEVPADQRHQHRGEGDDPAAGARLGRTLGDPTSDVDPGPFDT
jgi:hypothetical protein